jgi:hypothetical protein
METYREYLLLAGLLSSVWYVFMNILVPRFYANYSQRDYTVSELSAIGSPTRSLWLKLSVPYIILLALFGLGIILNADNIWQRSVGWLVLVYSVLNIYWPPMHTREVIADGGSTKSDTLHITWTGLAVGIFFLMMTLGALGLGTLFKVYTVVSILLQILFGFLTTPSLKKIPSGAATPNAGLYERINILVFIVWVAVFSVVVFVR